MKKCKMNIVLAILPILAVIFFGIMSVTTWKIGMYVPILSSIVVAAVVGGLTGTSWDELETGLVEGVTRVLPAVFMLVLIGAIVGTWMQSGIIPSMIYYSLKLISPAVFVPVCAIVTAVVTLATGAAFTSIATIGVALMAAGLSLGFPAPLLAGAILSGIYFGDSLSPLSDTTVLGAALVDCTLFELLRHMLYSSVPALILSTIAYYFMGLPYVTISDGNVGNIQALLAGLDGAFVISPLLLLVPVLTVILSVKQLPVLPVLFLVAVIGSVLAVLVQGAGIGEALGAMTSGYQSVTGIETLDSLLGSDGGIVSMSDTILLMSLATALGGILEKSGILNEILRVTMKRVKNSVALNLVSIFSSFLVGFATGAQFLAILLPSRMFAKEYQKKGLHSKNLARIAQSIGGVCINLVPWSVPAMYAAGRLGVKPSEFIPYMLFAFLITGFNIVFALTGITITKSDKAKLAE